MSKKKKINRNYLDTVFVPGPKLDWSLRDDGIVEIHIENKGFYNRIAQKFFKRPKVSHIALDKYGTLLWKKLDGENTVFDLVEYMKEQFQEEEDRMLDRTVTFMYTLQKSRFVVEKS